MDEAIAAELKRLNDRIDHIREMSECLKQMIDVQNDRHQNHNDKFEDFGFKLREVYYHIFPKRLDQDIQVFKQLDALKTTPQTDSAPDEK